MNTKAIFLTDDAQIKAMILRQAIPMMAPKPPNDVVFCSLFDSGSFWVVIRFYQAGDEGYVAIGIPENEPPQERAKLAKMILDHVAQMAAANGLDAYADSIFTEVQPVEMN